MIYVRFPGFRERAFTMSYDDGVLQDERLVALMAERAVKGTFNLNSGMIGNRANRLTAGKIKELYVPNGMEVAVHGLMHSQINCMSVPEMIREISEDRKNLEELTGTIVRGMAYAYGGFSEAVISAAEACGIVYARTIDSTHGFRLPTRPMTLNPTCHHNDAALFDLWEAFMREPTAKNRTARLFYLWGHSYEFDGKNNWDLIERFLDTAAFREEIWYATNIELCDYLAAFRQLHISYNGKMIFNPTAYKICFRCSDTGENYEISPGETVIL